MKDGYLILQSQEATYDSDLILKIEEPRSKESTTRDVM